MPLENFTNYPSTTVTSGGTTPSDTTWTVASSASFPAASNSTTPPTWFHVADANLPGELITVTNVSGTTWTVTRGAEGTTAASHTAGWTVKQVFSAGGAGMWPQWYNVRSLVYGAKGDGTTDDTAAINAALTAAGNAGGGIVYLPAGTYKTTAVLSLAGDNIVLRGDGTSTVIHPASGALFDVIATPIPGSSGTPGFTRNYCAVESLQINCGSMTGTTAGQGNAIHFYGARYCNIRDVLISSSPNWSVLLDGDSTNFGYNCQLLRCVFDTGAAGVMTSGCEANTIIDCIFKYAKTATAANQPAFTSPSTYAGHLLLTSGYQLVTGCVFGNGGTYTTEAVKVTNAGPTRITGNRFDQVRYAAFHPTSGRNIFANNQLGNPGSANAGTPAIDLGTGNTLVTGNVFDTTNGAAQWTYCVQEEGAYTGNVITGNQLITGTSGFLSLNSGSTPQVSRNPGYNPVGKIGSPPAVPASTGTATNNTGADAVVYVTTGGGVTISAVLVGGQAAGAQSQAASSVSAGIRVPAGQTISLTYAGGTPTWTWFGD